MCPSFFGHVGKRLDEKAKVNFKIYDAIDWEIIFTTHILLNQAMKFGQLVECSLRNILKKKSHTKCHGETNPRVV